MLAIRSGTGGDRAGHAGSAAEAQLWRVARHRLSGSRMTIATGTIHQPATPVVPTIAVIISATTTPAAISQSSPITKSYQNAPNAFNLCITAAPPHPDRRGSIVAGAARR